MNTYTIRRPWVSAQALGTDSPWIPGDKDDFKIEAEAFYFDEASGYFEFLINNRSTTVFIIRKEDVSTITRFKE